MENTNNYKTIYIVTGATGFVGNNIVKQLEDANNKVIALVRNEIKVKKALKNSQATIVVGDVTNADDIENLFAFAKEIDNEARIIFIHTASIVHIGNDKKVIAEMQKTNLTGTQNIITACLKYSARLVYISSVHAIAKHKTNGKIQSEISEFNPKEFHGAYAKSKAAASNLVMTAIKNQNLDAVLIHPSGISGPNDFSQTHTTQVVLDYANGLIPMGTSGGYDFVDVRDVARGTIAAATIGKSGDCYILSNKYYTVADKLRILHELGAGKEIKKTVPMWVARLGLPFIALKAKRTKTRPLYTSYSLYALRSNGLFSYEKAARELGYAPMPLEDSFRDTLEFLNKENML